MTEGTARPTEGGPFRDPRDLAGDLAKALMRVGHYGVNQCGGPSEVFDLGRTAEIELADAARHARTAGLDVPAGLYDEKDCLDEMATGVLYAYADVRVRLLKHFVHDPATAGTIAGLIDQLARELIDNNRDDDEDGTP